MKRKVKHRKPQWTRFPEYKWMAVRVDGRGRVHRETIRRFVTWSEAMAYVDEQVQS